MLAVSDAVGSLGLAIVGAFVTLGTLYINNRGDKRAKVAAIARRETADAQDVKLDEQNSKLDGIHVLVNSRLTRALNKITRLEEHISKLTGEPFSPDPEDDITPVTDQVTPVLPDMLPTIVPTPSQEMMPATVPHTVDPHIDMLPDPAPVVLDQPANIHYRAEMEKDTP